MLDSDKSSLFFKQIIYLIVNIGTDNLRDCLYFEVGKSNINDRLRSEELQAEFRLLWSRNCITEEEFDKLTRNPNPDTYDISLLMLLLANSKVCDIAQPLNGWIKNPSDSDLSLGADLVRLREIRNEIIDQEYIVKMTETHFEGLWVQIKHILTRIASRRGTDAEQNIKLKVKEAKVAKEVQDDNALDKFIHWYEQDTKEYQQCLSDVQDSLKDLHLKVDNTSQPLDEDTFKTDHESLQSKVKRIVRSFRLSAQHVFEIVSCGTVDTVRNALPYLDETVELITEAYGSIIKRWKEFKLFCNSGLPSVILRMDEKSIEMYKKALADGTVPDHSIRLMIVGHVNVGKTTLKRRLFGESVNIEERESTQGIEVHVGRCQIDMTSNNWIVQEKDCRIEGVYRRLAGLLSLQESPSNTSEPTEDQFERNDNEGSNLTTSNVNAQSEDRPSLNLEKELPIEQAKQFIPHLPKIRDERKQNDANQNNNNMDKDSCLADLKEILKQSSYHKLNKNQQTAELSIWDFAGQSDFYAMHQVFLSRRAVYLLVTKLSEHISTIVENDFDRDGITTKNLKIKEYIEFWLNSIYEYTQHEEVHSRARSNVILVGTFADNITEDCMEGSNQDFFDTVRMSLCKKVTFASLTKDSFRIDNTIDLTDQASKITDLRKYILETASKQSYWGQKIPAKWCTLANVLIKLQNKGKKVLTKTAIVDVTKAMPVEMQLDEIELFLNFHHESGNIIYYSHEEQLKEIIILQPQWLIDALKSILTSKTFCLTMEDIAILWCVFEKTAVLQKQLIDAIWNQEKYSEFKQQSTLILLFMEKLGLIARPYQSVHQEGIKLYPENLLDKEAICYCQEDGRGHPVKSLEVTKYWKRNSSKTEMHENTRGIRNTFVFNSGPKWQFLDQDGHVEKVSVVKAKGMVADAVCVIKGPTGMGTGFRVGDSYIMTAAHVIGKFLPMKGAFCDTNCYAEFNFIDITIPKKRFYFKDVVYRNQDLDVAVIELLYDRLGDLPPAFQYFSPPVYDRPFFLIGHSGGNEMEINEVTKPINIDDTKNLHIFSELQGNSKRISGENYFSSDPKMCYLFLCKFAHGASGSPGFVVNGRDIYVTTMLQAGNPRWYYEDRYAHLKASWRESDCVEQGLNMKFLYNSMQNSNSNLCQNIFGKSRDFLK